MWATESKEGSMEDAHFPLAAVEISSPREAAPSATPNTGAPHVSPCLESRRDSAGKPACELCGRRLSTCKGKLYQHGVGKICTPCYKIREGYLSPPVDLPPPLVQRSHKRNDSSSPNVVPALSRTRRSYESLQPTQKWERRKQLRAEVDAAVKRVGCPIEAIQSPLTSSPAELIHLPTSVREQIRSVPSLRIPCEQTMIQCKKQLATTHATGTDTFAGGAYLTDPLRFVSAVCAQSSFIAVGGDCGGGQTKLGITFAMQNIQMFACLLVYEGGDSWMELQDCRAQGLTPFTGDSAAFPHIWAVLQHLINTRNAFLNGDWPFINAVLGLMGPSATHPCPICIISHKNFLGTSRYRLAADKHSHHPQQSPLLTVIPERIVPTPLHLFLGISNRIILEAFSELLGKELVEQSLHQVTTVHSAGCSGASDLHDLNGPEICKWIQRECSESLLATAASTPSLTEGIAAPAAASTTSPATIASHSVLSRWLKNLHDHLLHKKDWTAKQIEEWRAAVTDIQQHWQQEAHSVPFPKLHMLKHSLEFAERHRFLGRASEAQIESFHAAFNALFHKQHRNQSSNVDERLRRSLADITLREVQPLLAEPSG